MDDLIGRQLGNYQIVALIGWGKMAAVYNAFQPSMARNVAIKILPPQFTFDYTLAGRFKQDARQVAQLQHPHILPIIDFGEQDGIKYLVMPLITDGTLADRLKGSPLPLEEVYRVISQIGGALDYAHHNGVVHSDVKPGNILMDEQGNCLLSDFSIVRLVAGTSQLTHTGELISTPAYMSPEQARGDQVDHRSDVYALGMVLYEMVTGRVPFQADTPWKELIKQVNEPLLPPHSLNPNLPEPVEWVVVKALAKDPADRYQSTTEMVQALEVACLASQTSQNAGPAYQNGLPTIPPVEHRDNPTLQRSIVSDPPVADNPGIFGGFSLWACLAGGLAMLGVCALIGLALYVVSRGPTSFLNATRTVDMFGTRQAYLLTIQAGDQTHTASQRPTLTTTLLDLTRNSTPVIPPLQASSTLTLTPTWTITPPPQQPSDSPRGKIVFTCQIFKMLIHDQICLMNADGSGWKRLTSSDSGIFRYGGFAADGLSVIYSGNPDYTLPSQIFESDLDGNARQLTDSVLGVLAPAVSPDGRWIAYTNADDSLWVMDRDGSNAHQVTPAGEKGWDAAWSPDSSQILFASDRVGGAQLYRMDRDGGNIRQVSNLDYLRGRSDWSPDGKTVATYVGQPWEHEIVLFNLDGSNVRQITHGGNNLAPAFSPDGGWITFMSYQDRYKDDNGCEIYTMKTDGSQVTRLTNNDYCDWQPRWGK